MSKILVVGAGGLGSPVLEYLSAAGVGAIGILDDDIVDMSNLHRQVIHQTTTVGTLKCESAKAFIRKINPHVNIFTHPMRLSNDNAFEIFNQYDLVLDCTDHPAVRYLINDVCAFRENHREWVWPQSGWTIYNIEFQKYWSLLSMFLSPGTKPKHSNILCRWWGYRSSNWNGWDCDGYGNDKGSNGILQ